MRNSLIIPLVILSLSLTAIVSGQMRGSGADRQVQFPEQLLLFSPKAGSDSDLIGNANKEALKLLAERCDVGFVDDGTNYWALRTAGASDELIKEIEKCTSPSTREAIATARKNLSEEQDFLQQKIVVGDLVRMLYRDTKTFAGKRRFLIAGKEYIRRYSDDHYGDPGLDELLTWLKFRVPVIN